MVHKKTTIPWESEEAWAQVVLSISKTMSALSANSAVGSETTTIQLLAQQIVQAYAEVETVLERVCLASCTTCADVCCSRATVWYDLKDLLIVYLNTSTFPDRQIYRLSDHSCCNLTPVGCRLNRSDRPFLCTWYICPDQKKVLEGLPDSDKRLAVFRAINKIKTARKDLEQEYAKAVCG